MSGQDNGGDVFYNGERGYSSAAQNWAFSYVHIC